MPFPLVLAGPIVRRVDPKGATVWVALSKAQRVTLRTYFKPTLDRNGVDVTNPGAIFAAGFADTIRLGDNLHVAVVTAASSPNVPYELASFFSYNLFFGPPGGGTPTADLASEKLLEDGTLANGLPHKALGFKTNILPGFRTPPAEVADLRLLHGSCRKPGNEGPDALAWVDDLLDPGVPRANEPPLDAFPQMLLFTGDQIYGDDVSRALLPTLTRVGNDLIGGTPETLTVANQPVPVTLDNFPAGFRQTLVNAQCKLTSGSANCHLLSFAEFCAMYLLVWSNAAWPGTMPPPTDGDVSQKPGQPDDVKSEIPTDATALAALNCQNRKAYCEALDVLLREQPVPGFLPTLPKVRRAMANIATYMILDDHEISDDLNISLHWKKQVYAFGSPGRAVVRNGLVAYAFFQGWGNDPAAFGATGPNAGFIALAAQAITTRTPQSLADLDDKLGISGLFDSKVTWHFRWLEPAATFGLFVLDSRTRRAFRGETAPPTLIAPLALDAQLPKNDVSKASNPGREVLFVLAPAPVLGVPVIEDIFQAGQAVFEGGVAADQESWSVDPACFEQLLARLAPARRVVLLSGDVHFGHGSALSYWAAGDTTPARFAQFTSSALKNSAGNPLEDLIRSLGVSQRIFRFGGGRARLGWNSPTPPPLTFPASNPLLSFPLPVRARFRRTPVLLPAAEWPAGVAFQRQPDFVWRLTLARDTRLDKDRPADRPPTLPDIPPGPVPVTKLREVANHHSAAMKTRGIARQLVFAHNLGLVTVRPAASGRFVAQHTLLSPPTDRPAVFDRVTVHEVELDTDPAHPETKPGLQP